MKILSIFGTRPEAIKMCPLIKEMRKDDSIESVVCITGQHKEMLYQVLDIFGIVANYDLKIMEPNQTLGMITTKILERLEPVLIKEKPDVVLVHGDTTTSFAAALVAFYQQIPVGHVEAGLRTYDKYSPFPEEMNRNLTGKIASLHFAPTKGNKKNLELENITTNVFVTGNTVIDAMQTTVKENYQFREEKLRDIDLCNVSRKFILMTAHRRENFGKPLGDICHAVKRIADEFEDVVFIYPMHKNPNVRGIVTELLGKHERIILTEPLDVEDMHNLINLSHFVLTDSGGLQEEAPALGKPVLVIRTETERPEAVEAGTVEVIGVKEESVYYKIKKLLVDIDKYERMSKAINPYGDGHACERIVEILKRMINN